MILTAGCSALDALKPSPSLLRRSREPRELVLLCRPQVLKLDDGSRSPGIVAQVFVTGGDELAPVAVSDGGFSFRAFDAATDREAGEWSFSGKDLAGHQIDHSLGPCYAFWLPLEPSDVPLRKLVVHARYKNDVRELGSTPVRVVVPGK